MRLARSARKLALQRLLPPHAFCAVDGAYRFLPTPIDRMRPRAFFVFRQFRRNGFIATSRLEQLLID
jgi:hypothetical protein